MDIVLINKIQANHFFCFQELSILQDLNDVRGECKAHANLGAVHLSLANYINAMKCYQEQLERALEAKDEVLEAEAYGNLGVAKIHLGRHDEAIGTILNQPLLLRLFLKHKSHQ